MTDGREELAEAERIARDLPTTWWPTTSRPQECAAINRVMVEYDRRGAEIAQLKHYVGTAANRLGVDRPGEIDTDPDLERVGEASLAEVERLRAIEQRACEERDGLAELAAFDDLTEIGRRDLRRIRYMLTGEST